MRLFTFMMVSTCVLISSHEASKVVHFVGSCRDRNETLIEIGNHVTQYVGNDGKINLTITVKQDIDPAIPLTLNVRITRCRSAENLDTCETFQAFRTKQYCKFLEMKSRMWGNFFVSFRPRFQCPVKKGVYELVNGDVNLGGFSSEQRYWKISAEAFYGQPERKVMCFHIDLNLLSRNS